MATKVSRRLVVEKVVDLIEQRGELGSSAKLLAAYLIDNQQTRQLELYLRDIRRTLAERYGLVSVDVTSAHTLSRQLKQEIKDFIIQQTAARDVEVIDTIQPDLISGVVISTTDAVYDGSLKNRIKKLRAI
jgi:F0F1-type ATP synthase delta subunit